MKSELGRILGSFSAVVRQQRGNIRRIEADLVHEPGYFSRVISGRRAMTLERLIDSLRALGEDVGQFFRLRAFPEADIFGMLDAISPRRRDPEVVKELRRVARRLPRAMENSREPALAPAVAVTDCDWLLEGSLRGRLARLNEDPSLQTSGFVHSAVAILDLLRYQKPFEAIKLSRVVALEVAPKISGVKAVEAFCASVGVFASAHRITGSLDTSARALREILPLAGALVPRARALMYQRISGILADYARYEDALEVSRLAAELYAGQRDGEGLGKAYVDQGVLLVNLEEHSPAEKAFRLALALLPEACARFRIPALQGLAMIRFQLGDNPAARREVLLALELLEPSETYSKALLSRQLGDIEKADGRLKQAEARYREAAGLIAGLNPFDTALVTLDLISVLLNQGDTAKAASEALGMNRLLQPFSSHPIAEAALLRLRRLALRGELDLAKLEAIRIRIEAGRTRAT